jgi:hypothetical protein
MICKQKINKFLTEKKTSSRCGRAGMPKVAKPRGLELFIFTPTSILTPRSTSRTRTHLGISEELWPAKPFQAIFEDQTNLEGS